MLPDSTSQYHRSLTLMAMQWGQFLDHDITATPEFDEPTDCCSSLRGAVHSHYYTRGPCFPIPIPARDRHFRIRCMEFRRSMPTKTTGRREQVNVITSYIDGSQIYGSNDEEITQLRLHKNGLLRTSTFNLLPKTTRFHRPCVENITNFCFNSGDVRINEFPGLASMHTVFHRAHNRFASTLQGLNPHWDDDTLFQESRRIVSALLQHITYHQFLPIVLGDRGMTRHGLNKRYRYSHKINADIFNSFATAAYRFGHSMITRTFNTHDNPEQLIDKMYFRPHFLTGNSGKGVDEILKGISTRPCQRADKFFSPGVSDHLFEDSTASGQSFDLVARNIQRGRDHGLPSYMEFFKLANRAYFDTSFSNRFDWRNFLHRDLTRFPFNPFSFNRGHALFKRNARRTTRFYNWSWDPWFRRWYRNTPRLGFTNIYRRHNLQALLTQRCLSAYRNNIDDVDVFVGGMSEPAVDGGLVGTTFAYILAKQFYNLKNGDRFWYESEDENVCFSPAQLREIKKVKLSRIMCDNTAIKALQSDIFSQPSFSNPIVSCDSSAIPELDLSAWRDVP
ncbi:peroxidasin homolog pxn-2-like [Gigantopelta aegis]|uniref:peroxidasin homolog pxn-2-like n=1 Tax=Gigantopelta aegis TaxID=1735272 RepID=UPI001B88C9CB|nr:peroxidasin homolog pxn-2-like [Gigantopelta aegis]